MYGCVFGSTSGFTRNDTGATRPTRPATAFSVSSSAADSTLKHRMPAASAASISASVLPTPENTILRDRRRRRALARARRRRRCRSRIPAARGCSAPRDWSSPSSRSRRGAAFPRTRRRTRKLRFERRARVDVARRPEALGDGRQRNTFDVQLAVDAWKEGHGLRSDGVGAGTARRFRGRRPGGRGRRLRRLQRALDAAAGRAPMRRSPPPWRAPRKPLRKGAGKSRTIGGNRNRENDGAGRVPVEEPP